MCWMILLKKETVVWDALEVVGKLYIMKTHKVLLDRSLFLLTCKYLVFCMLRKGINHTLILCDPVLLPNC